MIFITNGESRCWTRTSGWRRDHAIDKEAIVKRLLRGYGVPIDTLEAPEYEAFDPSIKVPYDPRWRPKLLARAAIRRRSRSSSRSRRRAASSRRITR